MRDSVTNSFKEISTTYSTPQKLKGKNSQPIALRQTIHLPDQKKSTGISHQYSSWQETCKKKKGVTFTDCQSEKNKYKTQGNKRNTSSVDKTRIQKSGFND